ncbi:class I SAM-dependent methyltransferase [Arcicella sp. LKC2W]|uniref:class I SAM-dependent methyltransferase n=1 Tax=Arcicella sp. LKC2W TaxID=2984198 RepID=UPI002B20B9E3|nr:class I SAM-dependent methyltransferase [Arcicella sp. LKC2W]MEA5461278.1 class I SAM-dependent methyltransferase [Arcicella sp. LKC2W]
MTWEETVIHFRSQPKNKQISRDAYLEEDLIDNIERFKNSEEWAETFKEISSLIPNKKTIKVLDIGAGNGISSLAFALNGYEVTALEPDTSNTVGSGAIKFLASHYKLNNITIIEAFGENLPFEDESFDIVYGRQVMHHAHHLDNFLKEAARVLKKGGFLMTVRDHVIKDKKDKELFLKSHPLHEYYGGENAFLFREYEGAILNANLIIKKILSPSQSTINYSPWSKKRVSELITNKFGKSFCNLITVNLLWKVNQYRLETLPGKLYSFIALKE